MKQEPELQPGLWGPGQPEPWGPGLPPPPCSPLLPMLQPPLLQGLGKQQVIYQAGLPAVSACASPYLTPPLRALALAAMSPAEQGELGGQAAG